MHYSHCFHIVLKSKKHHKRTGLVFTVDNRFSFLFFSRSLPFSVRHETRFGIHQIEHLQISTWYEGSQSTIAFSAQRTIKLDKENIISFYIFQSSRQCVSKKPEVHIFGMLEI